jgi:hypothetical protein
LAVTATGRTAGYEWKGYSDTTGTRKPQSINLDEREISSQQFLQHVNLEAQKAKLSHLLHKYKNHFTKKPGKCNCLEYHFQLQGGSSKSRNSRHIPFALGKEM